jgi:hypothetical protein
MSPAGRHQPPRLYLILREYPQTMQRSKMVAASSWRWYMAHPALLDELLDARGCTSR